MPVSIPGNFQATYGDITSRARSILNDDGAQVWTDAVLTNHVRNAYTWVYNEISKYVDVTFQKNTGPGGDLQYTPSVAGQEQSVASLGILPADMYLPIDVQFRLNAQEEWQAVNRRDRLPERSTQIPDRLYEWEWRNRDIWVISSNQPGLMRIRYLALLPQLTVATDPILITNVIESLAHRTVYEAYKRRGQIPLAQSSKGDAKEFMDQVIDHLILNDQFIARRGERFGDETTDGVVVNRTTFFG